MSEFKKVRVDRYFDEEMVLVSPLDATYRYIDLFDDDGERTEQITERSDEGFEDVEGDDNLRIYYEGDDMPELPKDPEPEEATEENPNKNPDGTFAKKGTGDQTGKGGDTDNTVDTVDTDDTKHTKHTVKPETREKFDKFVEQQKRATKPKPSEVEHNTKVEKKVIDSINDYVKKQPWADKVHFVETQGSFAKGTDLAGSSDIDIFVAFDYSVDIDDIKKYSKDFGEEILKPISDEGTYNLMSGAGNKQYGEGDVEGVEVQILGISDVSLDQVKKGKNNEKKGITDGMKTDNDRSPHHTKYMKKALKGKEDEVRTLKRFLKDAGVYDASQEKQGFSGFSTEVLIDKFDTFENVLEYFANFEKGSTIGDYEGTGVKTPVMIADPIDSSRNLGAAFSHTDKEDNPAPNKNLGRLIKTAQHMLDKGEMPSVTKDKMPSLSVNLDVDLTDPETGEAVDKNKIYGGLQKASGKIVNKLQKEGYKLKSPTEKLTDDWTIPIPRINIELDKNTGKAEIDFGLDNFDVEKTELKRGVPTKLPDNKKDAWKEKHKGEKIVEKDGFLWNEVERDITDAQGMLNHILKNEIDGLGIGKMTDNFKKAEVSKEQKEFENILDKPKSSESYLNNFDFDDVKDGESINETPIPKTKSVESQSCGCNNFGDFVNIQMNCLKKKAKEGQNYGLLYDQPKIEGKKIKGTLAYAGVSLNNRLYLPEELQKGDGMTVPLILNHASTAGAEDEMSRLPQKFRDGLEQGLEMKVGEVKLTWEADDLTLYYEGTVEDEFFIKEIDDADMAVSLGLYYDSDSPQVCDQECYTMIKGAEFHEVSLVYHAGFPVATIEAVESLVKEQGRKALEFSRSEDPLTPKKDLSDIDWSE